MTMLRVSALICAMMVLTSTVAVPETKAEDDETAENQLVKRYLSCPRGWYQSLGRCFRYIGTYMTWAKAEKNCHRMRANLASVRNFAEHVMMRKLIQTVTHRNTETWIGGSDAQEEKLWLWSDGSPFRYTRWCWGEPNNHGGRQNCLVMNHSAKSCWDDLYCNWLRPSICVRKM